MIYSFNVANEFSLTWFLRYLCHFRWR